MKRRGNATSRKQSIKSGKKWEKKKKKSREKLADAYCQRHHQRSIYSGIYSSARGEHLCLVTSERQLPFQCCLIKTSQAAPLDCFDAWGPIVHKNQWLDRWGRGAGRGERRGGGGGWRELAKEWCIRGGCKCVCVCLYGGGGGFRRDAL